MDLRLPQVDASGTLPLERQPLRAPEGHPMPSTSTANTRELFAQLLTRLRGSASRPTVSARIAGADGGEGISRQALLDMERGRFKCKTCSGKKVRPDGQPCTRCDENGEMVTNPTLALLERLGPAYGVRFEVVAIDPRTNQIVPGVAPAFRQTE